MHWHSDTLQLAYLKAILEKAFSVDLFVQAASCQ